MVASFVSQMRALLWRNYLLKLHGGWIEEILSPLWSVIFLIIMRLLYKPKIKPPAVFPVVPLANFSIPDKLLIAVSPPGVNVENVMRKISAQLNVRYLMFNSSSEAEEIYSTNRFYVWAGIIFGFNPAGPTSDIMQYAIRMPPESLPSNYEGLPAQVCDIDNTDTDIGTVDFPVNCYLKSGFAYLQSVIDQTLMQINNITMPNVEVSIQMMKKEFTPDFYYIHFLTSLILAMSFSSLISYITICLVTEKEKKIREGMLMMGLRNSVLWLSWLVLYCVISIIVSLLMLALAHFASFFPNSNMFLVFAVLMLYGMSIMALAFLITPFFRRAQIASTFSTVLVMVISFSHIFLGLRRTNAAMGYNYKISHSQQWAVCLLSPLAFAMAIEQIMFLDTYRGGMSFDTIHVGDFPLYASMIMLLVDTVLYFLLAIYMDHVIPGEFGVLYKPWYFLMKSYWCPYLSGSGKIMHLTINESQETDKDLSFSPNIEAVSASTQRQNPVRIIKLTKTFNKMRNTQYAVKDFSLDIYEGHITALLGHNGAGKTTIINILTGLIPPTSGTAIIRGLDVTSSCDMEEIRSMCGICPQHDILYNDLTCREHLQVFAGIKGVPANKTLSEVDRLLDSLGLAEKGNKFASELSGGQKRKLSVAIALIGDPKIIFLDEPTAGMDPYSRRQLWSFLKSHKKGRIVLLTTHFMDEADILADRKAFIRQGQLQCCGSSLFLKNKYGIGYYLSMVVEPTCSFESVTKLIQSYISGAKFQRSHGKELSYIIPGTEVDKFANLFKALEQCDADGNPMAHSLGICNYGVSMPTLEEIFLKLGEDIVLTQNDNEDRQIPSPHGPSHQLDVTTVGDTAPSHSPADVTTVGDITLSHSPADVTTVGNIAPSHSPADVTTVGNIAPSHSPVDVTTVGNSAPSHSPADVTTVGNIALSHSPADVTTVGNTASSHSPADVLQILPPVEKSQRMDCFWALMKIRYLCTIRNKFLLLAHIFAPIAIMAAGVALIKTTTSIRHISSTTQKLEGKLYAQEQGTLLTDRPEYLLQDSVNDSISLQFSQKLNTTYVIDKYLENETITKHHLIGINILATNSVSNNIQRYTALYNGTEFHSLPAIINSVSIAMLQQANSSKWITTYSCPWSFSDVYAYYSTNLYLPLIIGSAFTFIPAFCGPLVFSEREKKVANQLHVSGVTSNMYWGTLFIFDLILSLIPATISLIIVLVVQVPVFITPDAIFMLILVVVVYIPSTLVTIFVFSTFWNKSEESLIFQSSIIVGTMSLYVIFTVMEEFRSTVLENVLHYIFVLINPFYSIYGATHYLQKMFTASLQSRSLPTLSDYFQFSNHILICVLVPILNFVWKLYYLLKLDVSKNGDETSSNNTHEDQDKIVNEDEDVAQEREKVERLDKSAEERETCVAYVQNLRKEYPTIVCCGVKMKVFVAVRNMSFAVNRGEVLGLLGPNGAGKSTCLSMMTAEIHPTQGKVIIAGHKVNSTASEVFHLFGFCPQYDALWDAIQLREHLQFYAAIKGIHKKDIPQIVDYFLQYLKISEHSNKQAKDLSGGTKRKLSFAIAIIGWPPFVLLDEPSTGMDPQAKRFLWDTISNTFQGKDRGAILTTHYMEEADALCSRVGIMVNGALECLGPTQHLKSKYGSGYLLEIKLTLNNNDTKEVLESRMAALEKDLLLLFPGASCLESFDERAQYRIPSDNVTSMSSSYAALENIKKSYRVEEYSFSQSTLEQVFVNFAKKQLEEGEDVNNIETKDIHERKLTPCSVQPLKVEDNTQQAAEQEIASHVDNTQHAAELEIACHVDNTQQAAELEIASHVSSNVESVHVEKEGK